MKFENTEVWGFEHALRGMRNPKNSWDKSDSFFGIVNLDYESKDMEIADEWVKTFHPDLSWPEEFTDEGYNLAEEYANKLIKNGVLRLKDNVADLAFIGPNDMKLAQTLINGGSEHRKFLRQICVSVDITAPLYWWKEADTYKIGTTANSTSTMHKLTSKPITLDCFEIDDFDPNLVYFEQESIEAENTVGMLSELMIEQLEMLRQKYIETKDKQVWKELVRWLPESWLQTRTWTANYEVIRTMVHQRKDHKLNEWSGKDNPNKPNFIAWAHSLPYANEFIFS
jgi:hypothetical protein